MDFKFGHYHVFDSLDFGHTGKTIWKLQMKCPNCGLLNHDASLRCDCGYDFQTQTMQRSFVEPPTHGYGIDFVGTSMQMLGWILLTIVASLIVVPLAWVYAAVGRWLFRNLRFSDSTTAAFRGTGGQIVGWLILYAVFSIALQIANIEMRRTGIGPVVLVYAIFFLGILAVLLKLTRWFVSNVELHSGPPLSFTGTYLGILGWYLLMMISFVTIIGWA